MANENATSQTPPLDAKAVRLRIQRAYNSVREYINDRANERLKSLWPEWERHFKRLDDDAKRRPEVEIALVGTTGAGKSTLINALIEDRLLPASTKNACTSAVCQLGYDPARYSATVEFVTREEWQQEVENLVADLRDEQFTRETAGEDLDALSELPREARAKLEGVYGLTALSTEIDSHNFVETPEIADAFNDGARTFQCESLKELGKRISQYVDRKHRFWPIVKSVDVRGPFRNLSDGVRIIDLPGLNDPNEAREQVTRKYLKRSRFVWIVFSTKRSLTKDIMEFMESGDFFRQIILDGRADSLTLIGTHADEFDLATALDELELQEGTHFDDVVRVRNESVRVEARAHLGELIRRLAVNAQATESSRQVISAKIKSSSVFAVSSKEYLRIREISKTNSAGFNSIEQTEIPALVEHMRKICADYGVAAHCEAIDRQLRTLFAEIKCEIESQQASLKARAETTSHGREKLEAAVQSARDFLERDLEEASERLVEILDADQSLLAERIKRAVERAQNELRQTCQRWHGMHWATMRAVCRRNGVHVGKNGKSDFPADLSKPILDGIAFAWTDFFGDRLQRTLEKRTDILLRVAEKYRGKLVQQLEGASDVSGELVSSMERLSGTTEKVLKELLGQISQKMQDRIEADQRSLYETVPNGVRENMREAFEEAAEQSGSGMKQRMVEILTSHAQRVSQVMFDDARESLLAGVRGLNDWLVGEHRGMIDAVRRNAKLAAENLLSTGRQMTEDMIEEELDRLSDFLNLLADLDQASPAS